ncbi:hypothetical protein DFP93_11085 [Aneurinibacillus soli]|uniref:Uncharacterized protein n=1 Tax=Aneurinibacillus soli TaxID=1500254 RepID=A0A0U5AZC7_9BACL|nr:hypothetical protein [Aneurinibacillus soli]PYE61279.1 hypothetical protein DFP93_11085 [Aneurinibacillus soli]BAU26287.1 hypothetical protein CB4_00401 [Aneurinibacillus soli]
MANEYLNAFPPAELSGKEVEQLQSLERQLSQETSKEIILMAFEKSNA